MTEGHGIVLRLISDETDKCQFDFGNLAKEATSLALMLRYFIIGFPGPPIKLSLDLT